MWHWSIAATSVMYHCLHVSVNLLNEFQLTFTYWIFANCAKDELLDKHH